MTEAELVLFDDTAPAWERAFYAFLAEKERRSGSTWGPFSDLATSARRLLLTSRERDSHSHCPARRPGGPSGDQLSALSPLGQCPQIQT